MSTVSIDIDRLRTEASDWPGRTVPVERAELTELLDRLEAAESKLAEFHAWVEQYKDLARRSMGTK